MLGVPSRLTRQSNVLQPVSLNTVHSSKTTGKDRAIAKVSMQQNNKLYKENLIGENMDSKVSENVQPLAERVPTHSVSLIDRVKPSKPRNRDRAKDEITVKTEIAQTVAMPATPRTPEHQRQLHFPATPPRAKTRAVTTLVTPERHDPKSAVGYVRVKQDLNNLVTKSSLAKQEGLSVGHTAKVKQNSSIDVPKVIAKTNKPLPRLPGTSRLSIDTCLSDKDDIDLFA